MLFFKIFLIILFMFCLFGFIGEKDDTDLREQLFTVSVISLVGAIVLFIF